MFDTLKILPRSQENLEFLNFLERSSVLYWHLEFLGKILDFILDILTTSWILSWISSKILPELARSWQDLARCLQHFERSWHDLGRSCKMFARSLKIWKELGKIFKMSNAGLKSQFGCFVFVCRCFRLQGRGDEVHEHSVPVQRVPGAHRCRNGRPHGGICQKGVDAEQGRGPDHDLRHSPGGHGVWVPGEGLRPQLVPVQWALVPRHRPHHHIPHHRHHQVS